MKKVLAWLVVLLAGAACAWGLWNERERRLALQTELDVLQRRLADTETRVRLCSLLAEVQSVKEAAAQGNYGQAQQVSSRFFDHARAESDRTPSVPLEEALEAVLHLRDTITAGLARADPSVLEHLERAEARVKGVVSNPQP